MKLETMERLEEYIEAKRRDAIHEEDAGKQQILHAQYMGSLEALRNVERDQNDFYDKQEKRRMEEEKNKDTAELERMKSNIGWKRMTLDILKIFVPSMIAASTAIMMQNSAGRLEETGSWTSEAGRQAHRQIPNIWKN